MKRLALTGAILAWMTMTGFAMQLLWKYKGRPGDPAAPPAAWPHQSAIARASDRATLVMLVHPLCPCSKASMAELSRLMTRLPGKLAAHVLFLKPEGTASDWEKAELWKSAQAISGVTLHTDAGGREAARFKAKTSGQTVLYDQEGRLLFAGGITGSRGHEGDNAGRDRIVALLETGKADQVSSNVYGCALEDER